MPGRRFFRYFVFGLLALTALSCALIVPPWALHTLWQEVDAGERSGLVCVYGFLVIAAAVVAYRESRR